MILRRCVPWCLMAFVPLLAAAGEEGVTIERVMPSQAADRTRLARTMYRHDFENRRDPDAGLPLPESADLDNDGWPDFWEPIRAVGYPEYLINAIAIVPDAGGQVPGAYRDEINHALRMGYDGTRVGMRTRTPVPVDPDLSYEFSLRVRDAGLKGARILAGVDWMRVDPTSVLLLRSDDIPGLDAGQADWAARPARMLVNDPPPRANAARLHVIIERRPGDVDGSHNGEAWFDDISLKPRPKIIIAASENSSGPGRTKTIPVRYTGLIDNVPDPATPGYFRGRRYSRRVEVTDVFNRPVRLEAAGRSRVNAGDDGTASENIAFPADRYGVYYFNIRLYDADEALVSDVVRAAAIMRRAEARGGPLVRSGKPLFGVRAGTTPDAVLSSPGFLRDIVGFSGAKLAKLTPWKPDAGETGENEAYLSALAEEIRLLRSAGVSVTGVVDPPSTSLADAVAGDPQGLNRILDATGKRFGLYMDGWQWGDDGDGSLYGMRGGPDLDAAVKTIQEYSSGLPMVGNIVLPQRETAGFPLPAGVIEGHFPATVPVAGVWPAAARVFPWLFEPYYRERGRIYPPLRLSSLAPPPADPVEENSRTDRRSPVWLSFEPLPALSHEANAAAERTQLERFLVLAVYAAVLSPEAVFLGELFEPERGLLRPGGMGSDALETMARPIYLAAGTLARHIEGTEYLGQIGLLPPFEAHAFRHPGTDDAVIAIWHNDGADERPLSRAEIANGPPLRLEDWAGNSTPLPQSIPVSRVPSFITGLSASVLLTRMSVRVAPEPPLLAMNRRQNQALEIVNHMPRQAPVLFRLSYAASLPGGVMEDNWTIRPVEQRINLPSGAREPAQGRIVYSVSPDPNSPGQIAGPAGVDKSGLKVARAAMGVNTSPPVDIMLYLPFRLQSEIDVEIEPLERSDDPQFITLQMRVRWFPTSTRHRGDIRLFPFHVKRGQMRETAAFPITVKALPPESRGDASMMFESVEVRIPRNPPTQTWVGLDEDGGSNFYIADVTGFLRAPAAAPVQTDE